MIHNSRTTRALARLVASGLLCVVMHGAHADAVTATSCDIHAAAMVAEMKASAPAPMSDQEVALVRETARKSCLAQNGGSAQAAVVSAPAPAVKTSAAPIVQAKPDNSFFGTLGGIFSGPTDRKPGNQRLLDRTQH